MHKVITFGIPSYNAAKDMDHCITSILEGSNYATDIEIIVVDDGSKDETAAKADEWEARYPGIIRAVHQENGGHGIAVLSGLREAQGTYYKVVDSDDWLDGAALSTMLSILRGFEERARNTGDLSGSTDSTEENINPKGRVIDLIIPVILLIIFCTIGMLYVGGFFGADASGCTDFAGDFIGAFGNTDAFVGLPWGGLIALVLTVIYLVARRVVGFRAAMGCIPKGFQSMISPIIILTLAVSLKTTLNALDAAGYVHDLMYAASEGLYNMLPAVIFLVACVLAFASGTSWGTFGILIPIVTAIFPNDSALLYIGISACCAGAVCGDHCSPISDTTIMSSAGAQCEHVNHVATQLPYAITVACLSFVCFALAGFIQNWIICLAIGAALTVCTLFVIRRNEARKARIRD